MRRFMLVAAGMAAAFAITAASPALAKGPGWKANGGTPPGYSHGSKLGWASASYPPGFSHGRKRGWHGGSYPPGWSHSHR